MKATGAIDVDRDCSRAGLQRTIKYKLASLIAHGRLQALTAQTKPSPRMTIAAIGVTHG